MTQPVQMTKEKAVEVVGNISYGSPRRQSEDRHYCLEVTGLEADHHFDLAPSLVGAGKRQWHVQLEMGFW